jgi:hypothetical protein
MPANIVIINTNQTVKNLEGLLPFRADVTLKGILEMGTSPMVVLATTSAEPLSSNSTFSVSVANARNVAKTVFSKDRSGCLEKEISRSATFPVDTPPIVLDCGSLSYARYSHQRAKMTRAKRKHLGSVMATCSNNNILCSLHNL